MEKPVVLLATTFREAREEAAAECDRLAANAVIAALAEAGFVIVPKRPTEAMVDVLMRGIAGLDDGMSDGFRRATFRAACSDMLAAAPGQETK